MAYTTINKSTDYFNTKLYTGNGSTGHAITGVGFQPDLVWLKNRSVDDGHIWTDAVRGAPKSIASHSTTAEANNSENTQSLNSDGFTVGNNNGVNRNNSNFASWNWLAGGTASSNSNGSITSSVSANTTSGFSIVSYTGNQTNSTVGHGLGVAPKLIIFKNRVRSDGDWIVGSTVLSSNWSNFLYLSGTNAVTNLSLFQDTAPTSSFFYLGTNNNINQTGSGIIAYCFAEKKGFSKFGSYTGNGTSGVDGAGDGTFVYTGFKPSMIIIKPSSAVENWQILDNKRPGFNESDNLAPNNNAVENTSNDFVDLVSNGFKLRSGTYSASGVTYIYMAFAENPFVANDSGTAVPVVAR